jgi:hypothetical protein
VYIALEDGVHVSTQDAGTRQDLIENGVERELQSIRGHLGAAQDLGAAAESGLEHDLVVWPREYLESYLDSAVDGTIPLNQAHLQDLLEAAFDRDEELIRNDASNLQEARRRTPQPDSDSNNLFPKRSRPHAALTDSGVYTGKIISETPELIIQQVSATTEIPHPKFLLAQIPQVCQLVRIAYHDNVASVREIDERNVEKELSR